MNVGKEMTFVAKTQGEIKHRNGEHCAQHPGQRIIKQRAKHRSSTHQYPPDQPFMVLARQPATVARIQHGNNAAQGRKHKPLHGQGAQLLECQNDYQQEKCK